MELILIRHPETVAQRGVCYGSLDIAADPDCLTADSTRLKPIIPPEARLVSSPMQRAFALASALGEPEIDTRLVEMDFGEWEGQRWTDLPREEIDAWANDLLSFTPPGGEALQTVAERTLDWWYSIDLNDERPLVAVAHGGPWRTLAAHLMGVPLEHSPRFEINWGGRAHFRVTPEMVQLCGWNLL